MQTLESAQQMLLTKMPVQTRITRLSIDQALNCILAEDIVANVDVPPHNHSMMDGYAINSQDFSPEKVFSVSQRIPAGVASSPLEKNTAARIFTGGMIPEGADVVIMQEMAHTTDNGVQFEPDAIVTNKHIRFRGESIQQGQAVLNKGHRLCAPDISLLGSAGRGHVDVIKPITVVTVTTGDELLQPGETPQPGKIYNANRPMLHALLEQLGVDVVDLGQIRDSLEDTINAFEKATKIGDVILTTGGVSTGEEDHVKAAVEKTGHLQMWKVAMKPGKPIAFGQVHDTPLIGLPGNPVSAFVAFNLFAMPLLLKMSGVKDCLPKPIWIQAGFDKPATPKRVFLRGHLLTNKNQTTIELYPDQGVGMMRATEWGQGLVDIAADQSVTQGQMLPFYPLTSLR